ncbi:hypothetical protein PQR53_28660 [Paraburkholderia fungorum]|uniref:hypothetical protein n=1 Tax=Paraburkholderia fungorum TaxID=134537 RepID=UPI0038B9D62C
MDIVVEDTGYGLPLEILAAYGGGVDVLGKVQSSVSRRSLIIGVARELTPGSRRVSTFPQERGPSDPRFFFLAGMARRRSLNETSHASSRSRCQTDGKFLVTASHALSVIPEGIGAGTLV